MGSFTAGASKIALRSMAVVIKNPALRQRAARAHDIVLVLEHSGSSVIIHVPQKTVCFARYGIGVINADSGSAVYLHTATPASQWQAESSLLPPSVARGKYVCTRGKMGAAR